jgi:hypothetical protein
LLDYVISNCKSLFVNLNNFPIVNIDAHHLPLEINFTVKSGFNYISNNEIKYNWDKADYASIIKSLGNFNWTELLNNNRMDTNIELFYNIVYSLINQFVPTYFSYKSSFSSWFSNNFKHLIKLKKKAHLRYKQSNAAIDYLKFSTLRAQCKSLRNINYSDYLSNIQKSIKYNTKSFWKFFNDKNQITPFQI